MSDPKQPATEEHEEGGRAVEDEGAVIQHGADAAAEEPSEGEAEGEDAAAEEA